MRLASNGALHTRSHSTTSQHAPTSSTAQREPLAPAPRRINTDAGLDFGQTRRGVVRPQLPTGLSGAKGIVKAHSSSSAGSKGEVQDGAMARELEHLRQDHAIACREQQRLQIQLMQEREAQRKYQDQLTLLQAELGDHRAAININAERERARKEFDSEVKHKLIPGNIRECAVLTCGENAA